MKNLIRENYHIFFNILYSCIGQLEHIDVLSQLESDNLGIPVFWTIPIISSEKPGEMTNEWQIVQPVKIPN